MYANTVACDKASEYVTTTNSLFTQSTTVFRDNTLESSTILATRLSTFSVPPHSPPDLTSQALVASLSSIIVLLVITLILITAVFVMAWKKREKRVGEQCEKCTSKLIKRSNV